jgi:predicted Na+-dependent transporter
MQYLLPGAVFLLMVSVGMSLKLTEVIAHWRRMNAVAWTILIVATFIVPPALALLVANLFRLTLPETAGIFLVGVAPGAPLLTRNLARRGFDMQIAASYQVWAALMVPVMIPLLVWGGARLYGRSIWIPPGILLRQIILKQFLPLAVGILLAWIAPKASQRAQPTMNVLGNVLLTVMIVLVSSRWGPPSSNSRRSFRSQRSSSPSDRSPRSLFSRSAIRRSRKPSPSATPTATWAWRCCSPDNISTPSAPCPPSHATLSRLR